jgi:hypothetical protein
MSINGQSIYIDWWFMLEPIGRMTKTLNRTMYVCGERPSKNCVTCIVFVIQHVCTAYLTKDRHHSSPITLKNVLVAWLQHFFTWIARSQIVLDALINEIDQVTVLTDEHRNEQITLQTNIEDLKTEFVRISNGIKRSIISSEKFNIRNLDAR